MAGYVTAVLLKNKEVMQFWLLSAANSQPDRRAYQDFCEHLAISPHFSLSFDSSKPLFHYTYLIKEYYSSSVSKYN